MRRESSGPRRERMRRVGWDAVGSGGADEDDEDKDGGKPPPTTVMYGSVIS